MKYTAEYSREAESYLRRASPELRARIVRRVEELCEDPLGSRFAKSLHGTLSGTLSSRVGEIRILFEVYKERLVVSVIRIGPRGDVYRG